MKEMMHVSGARVATSTSSSSERERMAPVARLRLMHRFHLSFSLQSLIRIIERCENEMRKRL